MAISSISGGLMMLLLELEFPFSGLLSSFFWEKKIYSTGRFKMENPGRLEMIFQGNFSMTFTGSEDKSRLRRLIGP